MDTLPIGTTATLSTSKTLFGPLFAANGKRVTVADVQRYGRETVYVVWVNGTPDTFTVLPSELVDAN